MCLQYDEQGVLIKLQQIVLLGLGIIFFLEGAY